MKICPICGAKNYDVNATCEKCKHPFNSFKPTQPKVESTYKHPAVESAYRQPAGDNTDTQPPIDRTRTQPTVDNSYMQPQSSTKNHGLRTTIMVFLLLSLIGNIIFSFAAIIASSIILIKLELYFLWILCFFTFLCSPIISFITTKYYLQNVGKIKFTLFFEIFTLLLVNFVAGVLMLFDEMSTRH